MIYMYHDEHLPPHCHAVYAGQYVQVRFKGDIEIIGEFPAGPARLVRRWAAEHREALMENWARAGDREALKPIDPVA
ncbi:MAG TPA: DUF4160 domain-containing protein [Tepidiformaceae bacterium]|nr:DUF4160 domain-containing protein [Tepidiformaceae bacterium]